MPSGSNITNHAIDQIQTGGGAHQDDAFGDVRPPGIRIELLADSRRYFKRFKVRGKEIIARIVPPPPGCNVLHWLEGAFRDLLTFITGSCNGEDFVGMSFSSDSLPQGSAWLSFRPVRDCTFADIWDLITSIAQSAASLDIIEKFEIKTCIVKGVEGSGRKGLTHEDVAKKSILTIRNNDNLCLPRSLVTALAYAERGEIRTGALHTKWQKIRQLNGSMQLLEATELTNAAGITIPLRGAGVYEITRYQNYLAQDGVAIIVYEFLTLGRRAEPLFDGTHQVLELRGTIRHTLNILYYERSNHFQPILNLRGAVGCRDFCSSCNAQCRRLDHRCKKKKCPRCFTTPPCDTASNNIIECNDCEREFYGIACFNNHVSVILPGKKKAKTSVCATVKRCTVCFKTVRPAEKKKHLCGTAFCKTCRSVQVDNHLCFMRPVHLFEKQGKVLFIFYDFETQQCTPVRGAESTRLHVPNLCVAQRVCAFCSSNNNISEPCVYCGQREFIFRYNPVGSLVNLAMQKVKGFSRTICIAHNAGGFDAQFILRYLIEEKKTQLPSLIMNGTKIISMRLEKLVFLDSLNYFHMPLSALPKAFGLTGPIAKGIFPHLFNKPENQNYVGELPTIDYYSPETMSKNDREKLMTWYRQSKENGYIFDFAKEIVNYCRDDVTILRRACMVFRDMFMTSGRVCPFDESTTIASACFRIYRKNFLKDNTIGIIPTGGYRWAHNQSKKAIAWLVWMEHVLGHPIVHACRGREFKLPQNLLVDGYYETNGISHVLQFHGCYWHGCLRCYPTNRDLKQSDGLSMHERFEKTVIIRNRILSGNHNLKEIWECEYDQMIKENTRMSSFLCNHPLVRTDPLDPRDAFFGGRTENMVTLYDANDMEQIRYVDVCSLYPYICKFGKYPVGHPKVYVGDECKVLTGPHNTDLSRVEGIVKCTVLPPRNLYHPVLPVRMHNRLLFALCRTCCEIMNQNDCMHDDTDDRVFEGTWVVDELQKAISVGYIIMSVSEIWQYEVTQLNRDTQEGGHFTDYINTFLKIKQEASGWPENCLTSDAARKAYIEEFEKSEGIKMNHDSIEKNPGLRSVAKLCLNSFWGKFGQRENLPQTTIVSTRKKLMEMLTSPETIITGILPVNNDILYVNHVKTNDTIEPSGIASSVIAAYTTAQARLKLYSYLELLDKRALYCDTDSVIYVTKNCPDEFEPPTGQMLGDLTDELTCYGKGCYIKSFVSGGPKFYAFVVHNPNGSETEVCKVKGITLNFSNSALINYKSIRSFIVGEREEPVLLQYDAIRRTAFHHVITRTETKKCKPASVKRRRDGEYGSLPYGYCL
ncbi:uncharacterized protein [Venturia canescens]|uniref:uncharacterized protein n=1 Tax=Venturia canescens TaxID=32260 RepID=UPI001C9C5AB2|nr:uncharacterized protein LOC122406615 [Venturia canescens]XP_043268102.1 uncharacterized protein LOC122406615 [Venturia canescens]XP_043274686.1 uncharacterized protein LOC122410549 [Venturia canescens]XP_043274687.1 uncharacterized protein LOC122410549 [Venturia canescens]XP_043288805.1 uncharacterized protein LOC122418598 [Venturia canescens]XP_043288806.1 uncharacterized protein LOC122418598 [Venturia canescens]